MYTMVIFGLCLVSILLVTVRHELYRTRAFTFWLMASCMVGWTEFVFFLRFDAWLFSPDHVLGVKVAGVTIEDILFCPCFSVIFYWLYNLTEKRKYYRIYNPTDKMLFTLVICGIALIYYDFGSRFAQYMSLRAGIGFVGLVYCWNRVSFRHSVIFTAIVYLIGFGWDLPSVALGVWTYPATSSVYDGTALTILGARFPVEIFGYYFTGGFFSYWTISFFRAYFSASRSV